MRLNPRLLILLPLLAAAAPNTAISGACPCNLVPNPGFEAGNTGFTSFYRYQSNLFPDGTYFIGADPNRHNPNWTNATHPHSGAAMMIVNGAEIPNVQVWAAGPLAISPNTTYFFSFWIASVHPASPAILSFSINGAQVGKNFSAGSNVGAWVQACVPWFSAAANTVSLAIVNQNTAFYGNDFALDDISFAPNQPCAGEPLVSTPPPYTLAAR